MREASKKEIKILQTQCDRYAFEIYEAWQNGNQDRLPLEDFWLSPLLDPEIYEAKAVIFTGLNRIIFTGIREGEIIIGNNINNKWCNKVIIESL